MRRIPQDGENGLNGAFLFWSSAATKLFDFVNFSQMFLRDFARWILEMFLFWSWIIYRVFFYWSRPKSSKYGTGPTQEKKMTGSAQHNEND